MRVLAWLVTLTAVCPAAAQDARWATQPTYDDPGLVVADAPREREVGGFTFPPHGAYLTSLHSGGGEFAGMELALSGWLWLDGPPRAGAPRARGELPDPPVARR